MSNDPTLTNQALHDRLNHRQQTIDQQAERISELEEQNETLIAAVWTMFALVYRGAGFNSREFRTAGRVTYALFGPVMPPDNIFSDFSGWLLDQE